MKKSTSIRLTQAQEKQIDALAALGFGNMTSIITLAVDRMYHQEVNLLSDVHLRRLALISKFTDLNLGNLDGLWDLPFCDLENLIFDFTSAHGKGLLDLSTDQGRSHFARLVNKYF